MEEERQIAEIERKVSEAMYDINSTDPITNERAKCLLTNCHVRKLLLELKVCSLRVHKKIRYTAETCTQEYIDLVEALDHCMEDRVFFRLK